MSGFFDEVSLTLPNTHVLVQVTIRLLAALLIGTVIGLQREITHKTAGLRTHMLVALGAALFVTGASTAGIETKSLASVVQGLATGIGFLGGGAILKLASEQEIHGLTTAAGIWMTAAAATTAGLGQVGIALLATVFGLLVLIVFRRMEKHFGHHSKKGGGILPGAPSPPP